MSISMPSGLTITAPEGAVCGLYPNVPEKWNYFDAIHPENAIPATSVTTADGVTTYFYDGLEHGLYHCAASLEGYNAVCQLIHYTAAKQVDMKLDKLAGNGYEAGYVMLNTQEFIHAQLTSEKDTWGQEYARLFRTPQFLRQPGSAGRHQQTTNEEMMDFIAGLVGNHDNMYVFSLGKSPKYGFDMPLVLFTREDMTGKTLEQAAAIIRSNGKPTVQYTAQCHSLEPTSTEGALAMMLELCGDYGKRVLDSVDVYIVPRINPDGAVEVTRQSPTTGEDMNRDYLRMNNAEIRMVTGAYNLFLPEVCVDGHERRHYVMVTDQSPCADMELQVGAGSLNHPAAMTQLAMKIALTALEKARELGLRGRFYERFASAMGGSAGSSYYGARNSLSFLVETPGQTHLGMSFMERRVMAQYTLASTVIDYTASHPQQIMDTVHASREHMVKTGAVYDENDVIVLEHKKVETGTLTLPLLNPITGEVIEQNHVEGYDEHVEILRARPRATAYLIPRGIDNEDTILQIAACHAIGHDILPAGSVIRVRRYGKGEEGATLADEQAVCFEQGAYVFANTVPSTVLGAIMEPDFYGDRKNMNLHSMGLIEPDADGQFPLYRYCHDLQDGAVTAE